MYYKYFRTYFLLLKWIINHHKRLLAILKTTNNFELFKNYLFVTQILNLNVSTLETQTSRTMHYATWHLHWINNMQVLHV